MRFLKRQTINRRQLKSTTVYSDVSDSNVYVNPRNSGSMVLPSGTDAQIPSSPVNGMMRYNVDHNEVQVYQGSAWRSLRFKESTQITQQNLGAGDSAQIYFGPLSPTPPAQVQTGTTWGGQNIIVVVENVMQLNSINYTVVQGTVGSPFTIGADSSAVGTLSVAGTTGSKTLYFNTSLNVSTASWTGNVVTLTLLNTSSSGVPFAVGSTITVTGISPNGYNGVYTVTGGSATTVTYALIGNPGTFQYAGTVTASGSTPAIFASLDNLIGAQVTGTGIAGSSTVASYTMDPNTDALTSITLNNFPSASIAVNTVNITIGETAKTVNNNDYYLKFTEPVPYGKVVIALIGFDQ
jgi:hypothetical protein